jgi:ABC-2 type transport system permease protein
MLVKLAWVEMKIFSREPLGLVGSVLIPVLLFVVLGQLAGAQLARSSLRPQGAVGAAVPVFASVVMMLGAVGSLVTIVSIYREGGILKRLRATPLSPLVILSAHVVVKLLFTALTLALMVAAGRRYSLVGTEVPLLSYVVALLFSTCAFMSIGFLIASLVPTARFAQPLAGLIGYAMIPLSGLFFAIEALPPALEVLARLLPLTYAVSLLNAETDMNVRGRSVQRHSVRSRSAGSTRVARRAGT